MISYMVTVALKHHVPNPKKVLSGRLLGQSVYSLCTWTARAMCRTSVGPRPLKRRRLAV